MKKKLMSLMLITAVFGMASCDFEWPSFVTNIFPGLAKQKEEKSSDGSTPTDSSTTQTDSSTTPSDGGTTPTDTTSEVSFTLSSADSVTKSGVTVTFDKGSGSSIPAWYDNGLRLYAKNTITFSSQTEMKKIEFDWEKQGTKTFATATASTGSYTHPTSAGKGTWTGSTKSVVFTLGSETAQLQLNTFKVTIVGSGGGSGEDGGSGSGGEGGSGSGEDAVTINSLCTEICNTVCGDGTGNQFELYEGAYYWGVTWGTNSEYTLQSAVEECADYYLPESLVYVVEEPTMDVWEEDNTDGCFASYSTENGIYCELGSYEEDSNIVIQFTVYQGAE